MRKSGLTGISLCIITILITACSAQTGNSTLSLSHTEEEAMQSQPYLPTLQEESEVRNGTSEDTLATPSDFPASYDYGSGRYTDWDYGDTHRRLPEPDGNQTVLNTTPDPAGIQALYLWEEGNVPARTEISQTMTGYFDEPDFRPYLTAIPVREGTEVKGAVVLLAGGAFQWALLKKPLTWAVIFVMGMQSLTIYTTVAWLPTILSTLGFSASEAGLGSAVFLLVSAPASILTAAFIKAVGGERPASLIMTASFAIGIVFWLFGGTWSFVGCVLAGIPQGITFSMAMILMAKKTNSLSQLLVISSLAQGIGYVLAGFGPFICGLLYQGDGQWLSVVGFMLCAVALWGLSAWYAFGDRKLFD